MIRYFKLKAFLLSCFQIIISFCNGQSYDEALKEYLYGDLSKSINMFTYLIATKQEVPKSYMYRGAANSFLIKFDEAKRDLDSSFILDSSNPKIYYYYAKLFLIKKENKTALQYSNLAILRNPKDAAAYDQRCATKSLLGDFSEAIADADIAIALDSTDAIFYSNRGFAKLKLGQYQSAIKDFDISLRLEPNQKAYANRGLAHSLLNLHQKAIDDYTLSLTFNSQDGEVFYYRGISFKALQKSLRACIDFVKSEDLKYPLASAAIKENNCR